MWNCDNCGKPLANLDDGVLVWREDEDDLCIDLKLLHSEGINGIHCDHDSRIFDSSIDVRAVGFSDPEAVAKYMKDAIIKFRSYDSLEFQKFCKVFDVSEEKVRDLLLK